MKNRVLLQQLGFCINNSSLLDLSRPINIIQLVFKVFGCCYQSNNFFSHVICLILFLIYHQMTTKAGQQPVDEQTRDHVFAQLKNINQNNICIDCEKKNPKWASIHLGIHLCYDCAGKHRQYGVATSFIKSVNLDTWNQKQILYMQKGGNTRALDYLRKKGIISPANRTIDYKSAILRQYKELLTQQVQSELSGVKKQKKVQNQKKKIDDFFQELQTKPQEKKIQIPTAEVVPEPQEKTKKKKDKKKIGAKQINIEDFQSLAFDDGVPTQQKQKIVKEYEKKIDQVQSNQPTSNVKTESAAQSVKIEQPKQLSEEQAKKKMEQLKQKSNLKNISSDAFKDTTIDNVTLKQNLNKFSGSTSISSSAFFNKQQQKPNNQAIQNLKGIVGNVAGNVANVSQNLFSKLGSYWKK